MATATVSSCFRKGLGASRSVLCGGSLQLNNFASAEAMAAAGWTIDAPRPAESESSLIPGGLGSQPGTRLRKRMEHVV